MVRDKNGLYSFLGLTSYIPDPPNTDFTGISGPTIVNTPFIGSELKTYVA